MRIFITVLTFFFFALTFSQNGTIRGFVYEKENGEPIPFLKVKVISLKNITFGAITDVNGFYSVPKLPMGEFQIKVESSVHETIEKKVVLSKANEIVDIKFELIKSDAIREIEEVNVTAEGKRKKTEISMSQIKLDKKSLERIPSVGAENDVVGAFSVTPGVVTTGDQGGQLYVRGGTPIQNKILLDGMTIYTPFHSIGFFSIFETELVKNVDIYTGGFDAKYGGRISSVMDISYKDGNKNKQGGKISVSPFLAKLVLEGPIKKAKEGNSGHNSYIFSAKHSLLDYTSEGLYPKVNEGNGLPFNFTDLYAKITFSSNGGSKFNLFGFSNNDKVNYTDLATIDWKQYGGGMNFVLLPAGSPVFIRGHFNLSKYDLRFNEVNAKERYSSIGGADLGFDFTFFQKNEGQIDLGVNLNLFNTEFETENEAARLIKQENSNVEIGGYLNYKLIKGRFVIQPGIRVQSYTRQNVISPEPRLGIKYNASENFRLKLSGGRYSQNFTSASSDRDVVNLFNGLLSAPTNYQNKFTDENGKENEVKSAIQYSWHAIIGTEIDLNKYFNINLEGYFKYFPQLSNINQNKLYDDDDTKFGDIDDIYKKDFIIESGKTFGADLLLKYSKERWFLWGVYSYSYSTRWDGLISYYPVFDRRHNINLVATYLFGKKKNLELSFRWNLGSGLPYTPTAGFYQMETFNNGLSTDISTSNTSDPTLVLGQFNSQRLPFYHRLDMTVKKQFIFKNKTQMELIFSITNGYNRKNIFYKNRVNNKTIYQFPLLPSLGLSYKF
ncbi:MAG: TonB-dependent receptor [Flavobacteriia bacterium]|nr:TonB-dependent receptor [Flavobacteriia bacterium]